MPIWRARRPSSVLTEVGSQLVSVHGQADQLRLRSDAAQRAALDSLGGGEHTPPCAAATRRPTGPVVRPPRRWIDGATGRRRARRRSDRLRGWLEALETVDLTGGGPRALTVGPSVSTTLRSATGCGDRARPWSARRTRLRPTRSTRPLSSPPRSATRRRTGRRGPGRARRPHPHQLGILATDIATDLGEYLASLEADPARLAWIQDRRGAGRACREIGASTRLDDVDARSWPGDAERQRVWPSWRIRATAPRHWSRRWSFAQTDLDEVADRLTAARRVLAERLETAVLELDGLQMRGRDWSSTGNSMSPAPPVPRRSPHTSLPGAPPCRWARAPRAASCPASCSPWRSFWPTPAAPASAAGSHAPQGRCDHGGAPARLRLR